MSIIVFDSYDCAGKTTIAKAFSKKYNIPMYLEGASQRPEFKSSREHQLWAQSAYNHLVRILNSGVALDMIIDRWIFTELCYSPVLRGYDIREYFRKVEKSIASSGKIIWIFPYVSDIEVLKRRYIKKNESFLTFKNLLKVKDNYEHAFSMTKYPGMAIDTSNSKSVDSIVDVIKWFTDSIKE